MKRKIGIITLNAVINYGGILQSYALQSILEGLGFDVEKIERSRWEKPLTLWQKIFFYPLRLFKKYVMREKGVVVRKEQIDYERIMKWYRRSVYTMPFVESHIRRKNIFSYKELNRDDYYALVVGSDQIWRPKYVKNPRTDIRDAFLRFAKDWGVKRVAYAASFGTEVCEYSPNEINDCGELLRMFDAVSVRESSGIELCELFGRTDACQMIDPTLLLTKEDYCNLVPADYPKSEGDLMCYVLDKSDVANVVIDYVTQAMNLVPFEVIAQKKVKSNEDVAFYQPPVETWLRGFMDAKFIVTDSFHACVFSLIFGKPFIVIANPSRGVARYKTLLALFEIEDRLLYKYDKQKIDDILKAPFAPNMHNLEREKARAMAFLKNNLFDE